MQKYLNNNPFVAVFMVTYNHEKYISQAIESVLIQQTKFSYKIYLGEDCSTDNTRNICIEFAKKYPDLIKLFLNNKNDFKKNLSTIYNACLKSGSKYIAILDGDDYWTKAYKLQKQVDYLEANPQIAGCFHDVIAVDDNNNLINSNYYCPPMEIFTQKDSVIYGGAYGTCSLVFRSKVMHIRPKWFKKSACDYTIDLLITEFGNIAHISENMGAYRIHQGGIWQGNNQYKNLEENVFRYRMCLTNPRFKIKYGEYYRGKICELSNQISQHYLIEKRQIKKIKYAWFYLYYTRPKNSGTLKYVMGTLLFPDFYQRLKSIVLKIKS